MTSQSSHRPLDPHAGHDRERIAAYAAGDLHGPELGAVEALIRGCPACAGLAADLRSLVSATRALPPPARPARDFRLGPADAERLARGSSWRRLLRPFGTPASSARPLSLAFTTLGIAGLLLATLPLFSGLGVALPASMPAPASAGVVTEAGGGHAGGPSQIAGGPSQVAVDASGRYAGDMAAPPSATTGPNAPALDGAGKGTGSSGTPTQPAEAPSTMAARPSTPAAVPTAADGGIGSGGGPGPLVLLSIGFLVAGVGLFALRRVAIRLR